MGARAVVDLHIALVSRDAKHVALQQASYPAASHRHWLTIPIPLCVCRLLLARVR